MDIVTRGFPKKEVGNVYVTGYRSYITIIKKLSGNERSE